jgi:hypothetical protein
VLFLAIRRGNKKKEDKTKREREGERVKRY